ncbi:MAG: TetR/AcrR family transcriptional regulator [Gemmatimonadota bacterium]|nr:TetR/AcrR family transcriptional regulator [Gemmatimonadota bacterium]
MNQDIDTSARLERESLKLFADKGFRGATVREITRAAHANLGAVTYHFGSKRALHHAVLDRVLGGLALRVEAAAATPGTAPARLGAIVRALFAFFAEVPDAPRLVMHELAVGGPPPEPFLRLMRRVMAAVHAVVRDGQARGELRPVDPLFVAFTLTSQSVWFALVGRHVIPTALPELDPVTLGPRFADHITETVTRALHPEAGPP